MRILLTGGSGFIGTNAVNAFAGTGHALLDLSQTVPLDPHNRQYWRPADVLDAPALKAAFAEFRPEWVIHMAARTDCVENTTVETGYRTNTEGTANVLEAIKASDSVRRAIITSSQFVCGPGYQPRHDEDFHPVTVYGQSKVITEQLTRRAGLKCCWTIVRPTNIWGPWHPRYPQEFWRILKRGLYFHPGGRPVVRCYGYVGNIVWQMNRILEMPDTDVQGRVFYLGDAPADIRGWVNAFSLALTHRRVREIPRPLLRLLGVTGDAVSLVTRRPFYITSSRYRSMTSDYIVNMEPTFQVLGQGPFSIEAGVRTTVDWLNKQENSDRR